MPDHPALSLPDAARLLSVSEFYVRQMIESGRLKAMKLDPSSPTSQWRIPRAALTPWIGPPEVDADVPQVSERDTEIAEMRARTRLAGGGLGREALQAIASGADLTSDTRPTITGSHDLDTGRSAPGTPSGSVKVDHETKAEQNQQAVLSGVYREPADPHPSAAYRTPELDRELRAEAAAAGDGQTSTIIDTDYADRPMYMGREPQPFDGSSFGAGKPA